MEALEVVRIKRYNRGLISETRCNIKPEYKQRVIDKLNKIGINPVDNVYVSASHRVEDNLTGVCLFVNSESKVLYIGCDYYSISVLKAIDDIFLNWLKDGECHEL